MRGHAHVDFELFSQKSSGIPDNEIGRDSKFNQQLHCVWQRTELSEQMGPLGALHLLRGCLATIETNESGYVLLTVCMVCAEWPDSTTSTTSPYTSPATLETMSPAYIILV